MKSIRVSIVMLALCTIGVPQLQAQGAPWFFGVGTGIARLNSEGDQGFNTALFGPVQAEFDLAPDDFDDYMQTALGVALYATNGTWMLQSSLAVINLGDEPFGTVPSSGAQVSSDLSFDILSAEFSVGYTAYRSARNGFALRPHVGARLTRHKLGADLTITDASGATDLSRALEESWMDVLVGTTVDISLTDNLGWSTVLDAGFGGSEGTYHVSTALPWRLGRWSLTPNASFTALDFENGTQGDTDWYLYDANEFNWGLALMFHF